MFVERITDRSEERFSSKAISEKEKALKIRDLNLL